jgi:hypothetical protein
LLEQLHVMSHETSTSLEGKINTFKLEAFLRNWGASYIMPDSVIDWLGKSITGVTLKHMITAVILYKISAPFRYLATLGLANVVIKLFKRRGLMPVHPPAGSSLPELIKEQKDVVSQNIKRQREKYRQYKTKQQNRRMEGLKRIGNQFSLFKKNNKFRNGGNGPTGGTKF